MPRRASASSRSLSSTLPAALGKINTSAPVDRSNALFSAFSIAPAIKTGPPCRIRAVSGVSSRLSTTTRNGWRGVSRLRTFSCGSSSRTVPMPVKMAQARALQRCPSRLASGPVIHWLTPLLSAVLPSRLAAALRRNHGRPRVIRETKPIFSSRASFSSKPLAVSMPAARNMASPLPATSGLGSVIAATTRETPAAIKASAHGGVRPVWLQGSSVT